jgi:hypothetical protein
MLESFPDPLGKPMQIHEITRKSIKEDIVSGLTNMAWKAAGVANPLDQDTGPKVASNLRQGAAGEMNKTLLAPLAKEMQKRWAQTVQQLLLKSVDPSTKNPVTSAAQIDQAVLEKELYQFVNALAGVDIGELKDDGSGQANLLKTEFKPQITAAVADTQKPNPGANVWLPLATSIQRAKSIKNFGKEANNRKGPGDTLTVYRQAGKLMVDEQPYNPTNPEHIQAVKDLGMDPKTIR